MRWVQIWTISGYTYDEMNVAIDKPPQLHKTFCGSSKRDKGKKKKTNRYAKK